MRKFPGDLRQEDFLQSALTLRLHILPLAIVRVYPAPSSDGAKIARDAVNHGFHIMVLSNKAFVLGYIGNSWQKPL